MAICMPWRVGKTLDKLLEQINQAAPNRSKASDGSIGDSAHQAQGACASQHNSCCIKYQGIWIVRARDYTHDPGHGCDIGAIFEQIRLSRDWRVRYMIFNSRITGPNHGWLWKPYTGDNPHDKHGHVSTFDDVARFDNVTAWRIGAPVVEDDMGKAMFARDEGTGQLYLVDAGVSTPTKADLLDDAAYVLGQRGIAVAGPANPSSPGGEWLQVNGQWVRKGWSPAVFGGVAGGHYFEPLGLYAKLIYENWAPTKDEWVAASGDPAIYDLLAKYGSGRNGLKLKLDEIVEALKALAEKLDGMGAAGEPAPVDIETVRQGTLQAFRTIGTNIPEGT